MQKRVRRVRNSPSATKFKKHVLPRPDVLHTFLKHSEVNQYLEYLEHRYSHFVEVHTLGRSYEGRPLKGIEINWYSPKNILALAAKNSKAPPTRSEETKVMVPTQGRNFVFIEGGTHGREWISVCVALNCIFQLTEKCMRHQDLLRKLRFFIVPVVNPDGYEYTRNKNRRWRKNRRPQKFSKAIGTDCNRNYDFHWDQGNPKAHRNTYKGDKPFSEPETCALRNILQKLSPHLLFVLSLHSYAQSIMYPWGYSKDLPEAWQQLQKLAVSGRNAIQSYTGRRYRVGSIASLTKRTIAGSIVDYAYGALNVPLALVMELPSAEFGFQPPAEAISPIGHESWFGIREMCKCAYDLSPPVFPQEPEMLWMTVSKPSRLKEKQKRIMRKSTDSTASSGVEEELARKSEASSQNSDTNTSALTVTATGRGGLTSAPARTAINLPIAAPV